MKPTGIKTGRDNPLTLWQWPKGERLPEGRKHKKRTAADSGQREHVGPGAWEPCGRKPLAWGHWLPGTQAKEQEGCTTKPPKLPGFPPSFAFLSFCCMISRVPLAGDNAPRQLSAFPSPAALPFLILLAGPGKLLLVTSRHGDCSDSALLLHWHISAF